MTEDTKFRLLLSLTITYLVFFSILGALKRNYEFLYYTIVISILIVIIVVYREKLHLTIPVIGGLTILGALHVLGGNIFVGETRLFDLWLIPHFFRYDNLVHTFGSVVTTLVVYNLVALILYSKIRAHSFLLLIILVLMVMGVGALYEIIELGAVVAFGVALRVGDYMNNALDLFYNFLGTIVTSLFVLRYNKRKVKKLDNHLIQ